MDKPDNFNFTMPIDLTEDVTVVVRAYGYQRKWQVVLAGLITLSGLEDESWGIDNIRVSVVPEPHTAVVLILGWIEIRRRIIRGMQQEKGRVLI